MMALPRAFLSHQVPGRMRLRVPEMRNNRAFFEACARRLSDRSDVTKVHVNPRTASILIMHEPSATMLVDGASRESSLFELVREERLPLSRRIYDRCYAYAERFERSTGGRLDVSGVAMVVLTAMACVQMARGPILPAGWTILWQAVGLMRDVPQAEWTTTEPAARRWTTH